MAPTLFIVPGFWEGPPPFKPLIAEEAKVIPAAWQESLASLTGSEVVRIKAEHIAHLSQTQELAVAVGRVRGGPL